MTATLREMALPDGTKIWVSIPVNRATPKKVTVHGSNWNTSTIAVR